MPIKTRPRLVASSSSTTKLFVDDLREIAALSRAENKYRSDIIRELVHEALRLRRLRAIGRDEGEDYVRRIHQEAIVESVSPVTDALTKLCQMMESFSDEARSGAIDGGAKIINTLAGALAQLLQRAIVTENVVKVLMTVGMQKDDVSPEEIKRQLAGHDETGIRQSRELMKRLLGDERIPALNERE